MSADRGRGSRGSASGTCLHLKVRSSAKRPSPCVFAVGNGTPETTARGSSRSFLEQQMESKAEATTSLRQFHHRRSCLTAGWRRSSESRCGGTDRLEKTNNSALSVFVLLGRVINKKNFKKEANYNFKCRRKSILIKQQEFYLPPILYCMSCKC